MRSHRQQRGPGRAAWFGGEGRLLEWPPYNPDRWWAGNCSADLTRREDRSAQLGRGPKTLVIGWQRTIGS